MNEVDNVELAVGILKRGLSFRANGVLFEPGKIESRGSRKWSEHQLSKRPVDILEQAAEEFLKHKGGKPRNHWKEFYDWVMADKQGRFDILRSRYGKHQSALRNAVTETYRKVEGHQDGPFKVLVTNLPCTPTPSGSGSPSTSWGLW